jgi:hypothetical protein
MFRNEVVDGKILSKNGLCLMKKELITKCTNTIELRNIGIYLYEIKCKWGNKMRNYHLNCGEESKNVLILIRYTERA